ncbi:zinc finger, CCHC-type containing protein [Tanacetum coccineum]
MFIPRTRSEDPNQHPRDFLKLVDSLDLDGKNRERMRLHLFQFSICDQASNWLERLPARSITTWEDLATRFLAQFFPPRRTAKLRNDILIKSHDSNEFRVHQLPYKRRALSKEEVEEETKEETKEEEEGNPRNFDTFPTMNELRTSVIDHYLESVVFGKPFVEAAGLIYNREEGTVVFKKDKEQISDDEYYEKTHYSDSLDLGPEYKYDEYVCRGIRSLMATKARRKNKGEEFVGIKSLLNAVSITDALIDVNAAHTKLLLLEEVTTASTKVTTVSTKLMLLKELMLLVKKLVLPKDMDQDSAHMVAASKVPMLKPGEFELWRMRIEQYIQMIDYAL